MSAYTASVNRGDYCVAKAGLAMMTALFAARLAEFGINVYEIRPGVIATDMTGGVKEKYDALIAQGAWPIRRWGEPSDIGRAVAAIARGDFPFSTGEVINVDGGFHLRTLYRSGTEVEGQLTMIPKLDILKRLTDAGLVAVVRAETAEQATRIADAVLEGGCPGIEVTFTVPGAHRVIEALAERYKPSELILGAGTVLDPETARIAILSGATYVVSPSLNPETVRLCNRYQVPVMPGAMTIRDVIEAMEARRRHHQAFPRRGVRPGHHQGHQRPAAAGAADADRRRGCQQRRRVDQSRGRGRRRGQQPDRRREDRRLRGHHAHSPASSSKRFRPRGRN